MRTGTCALLLSKRHLYFQKSIASSFKRKKNPFDYQEVYLDAEDDNYNFLSHLAKSILLYIKGVKTNATFKFQLNRSVRDKSYDALSKVNTQKDIK